MTPDGYEPRSATGDLVKLYGELLTAGLNIDPASVSNECLAAATRVLTYLDELTHRATSADTIIIQATLRADYPLVPEHIISGGMYGS